MTLGLVNANPVVHAKKERVARTEDLHSNFVRDIRDPEHPYSLEQLSVLSEESITVDDKLGRILMATVIGLCLRVKLQECFPPHYKVRISNCCIIAMPRLDDIILNLEEYRLYLNLWPIDLLSCGYVIDMSSFELARDSGWLAALDLYRLPLMIGFSS
ncbi:hypothetical protein D5086_010651 [Populus alba]|uniref:Uncharacterized protein n=1 Tax=Populus alba TaxID=43335 RepID=A0ACC4CB61_POPAL